MVSETDRTTAPHHVVALVSEGVIVLDLAAPAHLFGHVDPDRYSFALAAARPGPLATSSGFPIVAERGLEEIARADTVIVPGSTGAERGAAPDPAVLDALRAASARGARVASVCAGAFVLAHAGLLDGRRATTHWADAAALARQFPRVTVDPDVLYVDEGDVLTSAGIAAGLDLCLHLVRRDHGADVAAAYARRTVIAPHRDGGQAQFIERPLAGAAAARGPDAAAGATSLAPGAPVHANAAAASAARATSLAATRAWALERLHEPLGVARMSAHAHVSPRTFARRFREETGTTPAQWVQQQRVLAAQRLLERGELPVEQVAAACGFGSAASLRVHFARSTRTSPTAYRRAFRTG